VQLANYSVRKFHTDVLLLQWSWACDDLVKKMLFILAVPIRELQCTHL